MSNKYNDSTLVQEYVRRANPGRAETSDEPFRGNRPEYVYRFGPKYPRRKKLSTFNIIIFLFGFAVALVLYISNIIEVNGLVKEINRLERELEQVRNQNEFIRAELNNRTGLEQIGSIANERLGLRNPANPPRWITVNEDEIKKLQRELDGYDR